MKIFRDDARIFLNKIDFRCPIRETLKLRFEFNLLSPRFIRVCIACVVKFVSEELN